MLVSTLANEGSGLLAGIPLVGLSAPVLLGIAVLLIIRGSLVPRSVLEDMKQDRNEWRSAHEVSEAARIESMKQVESLLINARHTDEILQKLADLILREKSGS